MINILETIQQHDFSWIGIGIFGIIAAIVIFMIAIILLKNDEKNYGKALCITIGLFVFEIIWLFGITEIFNLNQSKQPTGVLHEIQIEGNVNMDSFNEKYEIIEVKEDNILTVKEKVLPNDYFDRGLQKIESSENNK